MTLQEVIPQAKDILAMGKRLTAKRHYADDSIRPKCKELEDLIAELETKSKTCEEKLQRCRELEDRMIKVCGIGPYTFYTRTRIFLYMYYGLKYADKQGNTTVKIKVYQVATIF